MIKNPYTVTERGRLRFDAIKNPRDRRSLYRLLDHSGIAGAYDDFVLRRAGNMLYAGRYVGVIAMSSGSKIEILPKLTKYNDGKEKAKAAVIRMLSRVYRLDVRLESVAGLNKSLDLYEILIRLYLCELKKLLQRGLKSGYQTAEDNLPYLKGRLMIHEQIKHNAAHRERFYARYDEFTPDRPENRLIRATVDRLLSVSVDGRNRKELRLCQEMMYGIAPSLNIGRDFAAVVDDRTTVDYRRLMRWSRLFLQGNSFEVFSGKEKVDALLFPAEELFEQYVGATLCRAAPQGWNVFLQEQERFLCGYQGKSEEKLFQIRPDIVIRKDRSLVILDTKWKLLNPEKDRNFGFKSEDMYQMFAYARVYGTSEIWLLYPKPLNVEAKNIPRSFELPDNVRVHVVMIDLCAEKEEDTAELINEIANCLQQ